MEECPICCEMRTLKELSKCKLQESKHKICEECHNKSNNNCWLCGDKMVTEDVKIIEIRENSNEQVRENESLKRLLRFFICEFKIIALVALVAIPAAFIYKVTKE